jgi:hypothetical protein
VSTATQSFAGKNGTGMAWAYLAGVEEVEESAEARRKGKVGSAW